MQVILSTENRRLANNQNDRELETENDLKKDSQRALTLLVRYLTNDQRALKRFNPTQKMVQRMNIGQFIEREPNMTKKNQLIDLCIYVIQHSTQGLEFFDFTDNERLVWTMRRREFSTVLGETRSLENRYVALNQNFESFRDMSRSAFAEFVTLVQETKQQLFVEINQLKSYH